MNRLPSVLSLLLVAGLLADHGVAEATEHFRLRALTQQAIALGKLKETINEMASSALEAERGRNWERACYYYGEASFAARVAGDLQKAVAYGARASEMGEKANDPYLHAQASLRLSFPLRAVGQQTKARELLEKGLEIAGKISNPSVKQAVEGDLYEELGKDFLRQGELQKAIEYISYSLQVKEAQLTFVGRLLGFRAPAGLQAIRVQNARRRVVSALYSLGGAYQRAGDTDRATKAFESGLSIIKGFGLKTQVEANLYQGLGGIYLGQKNYQRALENLTQALEMAEKSQHASAIQHASSQIGDLFLQTQRPVEALPYFKKAIDTIESTRSLLESEEFRTSFFEDKGQTYGGIVLAHLGAENVEEAFNYAERARSRAFLDILGSKVQLARSDALLGEERNLQARIAAIKARLATVDLEEGGGETEREKLRKELEEAERGYHAFLNKVRRENKEQASLMNVEPLTLKQVQEMLEPDVTLLEYFVVRGRTVLWIVEKDQARFVRLALRREELISKVSALRESIYRVGEREKFKALSQELYRLLIEPALPHIKGKELLIIPHDVLHYLPYQALLSPSGRYLLEDYPIYYLSSASLMQFTRAKRRTSREKALVMGDPELGDLAYNLRYGQREAKEVARIYSQSAIYLKSEATKSRAISLSPKYDIIHFAAHGELDEDDPLNSGLLLAGDKKQDVLLNVGEIFSLNLKADTIVLSACETGLGKITSGDEIIGLTRAFIYAGTPSVITTLWKVNDRASYELMKEFYSRLATMRKSDALRQAQLTTMRGFPEPFFWAAYGLTGEP